MEIQIYHVSHVVTEEEELATGGEAASHRRRMAATAPAGDAHGDTEGSDRDENLYI